MDLFAHLEAYVAVAEERSFSAAADALRIAQPVLSRRIKVLEKHLGGELFDRSRRQISSTDLGVLLLPHAKDVLSRAEHLRQVARQALASTAYAVGTPPDCDPAALAKMIRAGGDRGVTIRIVELPAEDRAGAFRDGSLSAALLRMPPEKAPLRVPLGLAAMEPLAGVLHLESLRPRRTGGAKPLDILVPPEDQVSFAADRFGRAVARAGLPGRRVRPATSSAVAETLAGQALLVCTEAYAQRHDLAWAPLADATLHRGYEVAGGFDWLQPLLANAIGARPSPAAPSSTVDQPDARARLAARG